MADNSRLLRVAVDDNIAWCSRVCSAHGSNEMRSAGAWANLAVSPSFYPNIITSGYGVRDEIEQLVPKVRLSNQARRWGIKDSFADLDLAEQGFEPIVTGSWYGAVVSSGPSSVGWKAVASPAELELWEQAWGTHGGTIFPSSLLEDNRVTFWFKGELGAIEAGFISFDTGFSLGLSNWFSVAGDPFARLGVLQAAASASRGLPIVCWSADELATQEIRLAKLGPLKVWLSQ